MLDKTSIFIFHGRNKLPYLNVCILSKATCIAFYIAYTLSVHAFPGNRTLSIASAMLYYLSHRKYLGFKTTRGLVNKDIFELVGCMEKRPTVISILTFRRQNRSESRKVKEVQTGSGSIPKGPRGSVASGLGWPTVSWTVA